VARAAIAGLRSDGCGGHRLVVDTGGGELQFDYAACTADTGVGRASRMLGLPEGGTLEIEDADGWDRELRAQGLQRVERAVGQLERRWIAALAALVLSVAGLWTATVYGVPAVVASGLALVPPEMDARIGAGGLALLDRTLFRPTTLDSARQAQLRVAFDDVAQDIGMSKRVRLELRQGAEAGANAFALPDGIVILTDELARLAAHDDELRGVFAHEIGHVQHRHAMRTLVANSLSTLIALAVLGDVSSATTLVAGVPTALVHAANSRDFEREADRAARRWLREAGVPQSRFDDLLRRLEQASNAGDWGYLSSHPPLAERLRADAS
jgi:Zn-dependent protease with chaperone function